MKKLIIIFSFMYSSIGLCQSKAIDSIQIKLTEISSDYKYSEKLTCQAIQSQNLYKTPEMYDFILGKTMDKRFQTFEYKGKKGSILYFEFDKNTDESIGFIKGLLWGGNKPNKAHPENIIGKENILIVLSFPYKSIIGQKLTEKLLNR